MDLGEKVAQEGKDLINMQRLQNNLEIDYKQAFKDFEMKLREKDERIDRMQKDHDYQLSKLIRSHE